SQKAQVRRVLMLPRYEYGTGTRIEYGTGTCIGYRYGVRHF
ncbi:hypothetical protein A2U01_0034924, partial [Trifolium medium]|nr:hypothetical protein [Trifolium medium]